ncbi:MAG: 30S ribosomal protein S9 [Candidatus Margulisiibacteriota bacterium]
MPKTSYYGTGKRKSAIAKVWLFPGSGQMVINNEVAIAYLNTKILEDQVREPLKVLGLETKYDVVISTLGGGIVGQAGACQLGISRALLELNPEFRASLKPHGLLTRDPRIKERKKYGRKRARKGFQFRKR